MLKGWISDILQIPLLFFQHEQTESNINSDSLSILCIVVDYVSGKNVFKT